VGTHEVILHINLDLTGKNVDYNPIGYDGVIFLQRAISYPRNPPSPRVIELFIAQSVTQCHDLAFTGEFQSSHVKIHLIQALF
jgi:hypothetical protein